GTRLMVTRIFTRASVARGMIGCQARCLRDGAAVERTVMHGMATRIGLTAFAALLAVGAACGNQRSEARAAAGGGPVAKGAPTDETPPPGVDLSKLDEGERRIFFRVANRVASACGKAHSLLHSAKHDPGCHRSIFALRYVAKLADDGYLESEIV